MFQWGNKKSFTAAMSNGRGRLFEDMVKGGCQYYKDRGRAKIEKMPEPFRVLTKDRANGIATVRFTAHAQPDFVGCLAGGICIAFETKYTDTDKLHRRVLTDTQAESLQEYHERGAIAAVCAGIKDRYFMLPWQVFSTMKERYGRQYVRAEDITPYEVKFNGVVLFLDLQDGQKITGDNVIIEAARAYARRAVSKSDT